MKHLFIVLTLLLIGVVGCSDDPAPAPTTDGSTLIIQPDTLKLLASDSTKALDLVLSCGCNFTVAITSTSGDTNIIKCVPMDTMNAKKTKHSLRFTYLPSLSPPSGSSITVNFLASKSTYTYTNKAVVVVQ